MTWKTWLQRVRHDLVKRLLWPARDRRDLGGRPHPGELRVQFLDDEGNPVAAAVLWEAMELAAPDARHPALAGFVPVLRSALAASERDDVDGVLALEAAFDRMVHDLAEEER
jgi:hypothetical protein